MGKLFGDAAAAVIGYKAADYLRARSTAQAGDEDTTPCEVHGNLTFTTVPAEKMARTPAAAVVLEGYDLVVAEQTDR